MKFDLRAVARRSLTLAAAFALVMPLSLAAQEDLPPARDIIDRYVEAIGGADAVESQPARRVLGRVELPAQGLSGDIEMLAAPPNKYVMTVDLSGIGVVRSGYDGETAWMIHPAMGPMLLDGLMLQQAKQQASMRSPLHPDEFIAELETVERVEWEGCDCYRVRVVTQWDEEYFEFFDVETGLLKGSIRDQASPMGEIETVTLVSDYQQIGDMRLPMRSTQRIMSMEQVLSFSEVSEIEPADSVFALPPEIEALQQPAGGGASGR